ncbi:transposon Tf2-6 polyprotein [Trichonephila clavipes]|nr:transposon Tf2-6 polyprotein [Trichonephila clavipes]
MYKNALKEDLIGVVQELDGTVESTDTIVKLKTKIENSSTFESDPDFVKTLIQNCIDERVSQNEREVTSEQKIELAKLQLAKLEKEIELQLAKNKALSLNPAAKVEEKQFETNIENMIKSIKTLSLPVPTRSENFNLFFQSLERAFLTKKINDEYKSEILINLLGERAHNVLLYIKEEELNDYEKLKSIVLREFQLTPRECLNSFKNAVKSSGETYIQFAARLTANFQYYCSLRKVNSFESLCDLIISDKLFETLNKETATHIGIREAEDWFRPIDLAKECDIYISSRSGSHKEIPITYGYTQDPFKNRSQNFKPKSKENYPQYLERENKNCFICGDSSHYARDCKKRFKSKESNSHIHNRINVNTLKVESEKQNSDECANLQYVNIFVENQPVTALIDSGCQIPVLNSSLIRVQTPSEEIITLSSCFGEQRMVEVKPINISLNQHSTSLSVRTAISPTLTEEFIIHPSVYSEIEKLGHAKSDVLLSESGSSLGADCGVSFPNVSVSSVIENSSYDLPYVKNFNTRNDLSSLVKNYKCNNIKSTKLKLSIVREKCSDIVLCKKANGAMKTSSVEFISRSPNPLPMKSEHRRFSSGLHGNTAADSVRSEWPLWHAAKSNAVFARRRIEMKQKLLDIREKEERESCVNPVIWEDALSHGEVTCLLTLTSWGISGRHLIVYQLVVTVFCPSNLMALTNSVLLKKRRTLLFLSLVVFSPLLAWDHPQRPILCFLDMLGRQKRPSTYKQQDTKIKRPKCMITKFDALLRSPSAEDC